MVLFYHSPVSFHLIQHVEMMLETVDCSPKTLTCPGQAEKANQYAHKYPVSMPFQGKNFSGLCYNSPVSFHLIRHVKVMLETVDCSPKTLKCSGQSPPKV